MTSRPTYGTGVEKFAYKTYTISLGSTVFSNRAIDDSQLLEKLNEFGENGWELVSKIDISNNGWTKNVTLIFKKKKE